MEEGGGQWRWGEVGWTGTHVEGATGIEADPQEAADEQS